MKCSFKRGLRAQTYNTRVQFRLPNDLISDSDQLSIINTRSARNPNKTTSNARNERWFHFIRLGTGRYTIKFISESNRYNKRVHGGHSFLYVSA